MQTIKLLFISILFLGLSSCGLNRKAQVEALGKCDYSIASVSQVRVAGRAIESFQDGGGVALSSLPGIAMALLTKDLPLEAKVNLKVSNPTNTRASINQFKYIIEIQGKPLVEGTVNENVNLATGESVVVPLSFQANIFNAAKERGIENLMNDIFTRKSEGFLTLKIKPSISIDGQNIYYTGYITVDKNLAKGLFK